MLLIHSESGTDEHCKHFIDALLLHEACRNPTLAKCGGEAQHLEKLEVESPSRLLNV